MGKNESDEEMMGERSRDGEKDIYCADDVRSYIFT